MIRSNILLLLTAGTLLFTACTKEGDTIVNNYGSSENNNPPARKLFKEYGLTDSSTYLRFSYLNNEPGKLKELISYAMGVAGSKFVVLYNSSNKAEGYQVYALPANTLSEQGTFKMDNKGRVIQILKRKPNGDTIGIVNAFYDNLDYQPTATNYYEKSTDRTVHYDYFTYDSRGNVTKIVSYTNNGSDPLYKSSEVEASGFSKAINPLNQLYYYLLTSLGNYGFGSSGPLYLSNYFATSARQQNYNPNGTTSYVSLSDLNYETDGDNFLTGISANGQTIYIKY